MPFEKFPHPPRYEPLKKALITLLGNDKMYPEMGTMFENHKKSHSRLRAKWSKSVTRQVNFNWTKIGRKCKNANVTFWVIFNHCVHPDFD